MKKRVEVKTRPTFFRRRRERPPPGAGKRERETAFLYLEEVEKVPQGYLLEKKSVKMGE